MNGPVLQQVRKGRKFDQVLAGAWQVFMNEGYEGASVDDIARSAGVSKATLYSYFPDKRLLFLEVAKAECLRQAEDAFAAIDFTGPVRDVLTEAATRMVRFFISDFGQRIFRTCVSECYRFPEIGLDFYDSGPGLVQGRMASYMAEATERGALRVTDPALAAAQFHELCKADMHAKILCRVQTEFSDAEVERIISGAVEMFLARYGA
jgi:AcrR family transcriptional regulator